MNQNQTEKSGKQASSRREWQAPMLMVEDSKKLTRGPKPQGAIENAIIQPSAS